MEQIMGRFTVISEWIYLLFVIQMFWLIGAVIGLGLFGIIPSTLAMFAVFRKRLQDGDVDIIKTFWNTYRTMFFKSQLTGLFWILLGLFLYYDIRILFNYQNTFGFIIGAILISVLLIYLLATMILMPMNVHYEMTSSNRVRLSVMIAITMPHISIGLTLSTILVYFIATYIPILFLLCGISLAAFLYMKCSQNAFTKVEATGYIRNF
ncbi:DUF624 domain-containing protein [Sporosarcina sp. Marseille-Q4063]|uniref:YesL family protein n=1 Tax=Sporosarcina sp. Marseille-Q4063 TaxID=2810514 RepID=UPI001BAFBD9A|nr:DUF624 domain-containing protein [Sporosarcina sp. Marseille-Q4063]QUW23309.1 DUF624 domain-containing protein [Sporosarcina sp. Marseille-Q4063]